MKNIFVTLMACSMIFSVIACGRNVVDLTYGTAIIVRTLSFKESTPTQIFIQTNDQQTFTVQLNDSLAAQSFFAQLPLIIAVEDYATSEKIFYPPIRLDIRDAPMAMGPIGTLAYYEPRGNVAIFTEECTGANGLYELGEVISNEEYLSALSGEIRITTSLETSTNFIPEQPVMENEIEIELPVQEEVIVDNSSGIESTLPPVIEEETKEDDMHKITISIGDQSFRASLFKNATSEALMKRFPLTLEMPDMNNNEKYAYLADLPSQSIRPSAIHAGDLMLFGSDCLVLFYESFTSSYSYTPLGYVEDVAGFVSELGSGKVEVSFNGE